MAANAKKATFTSPRGVAIYPYLQPGRPDTQFSAEGHYKVQLKVSMDDAKPLMDEVRAAASNEFGKKASSALMPWKQDEASGDIVFTIKSRYQPRYCDASGKYIAEAQVPAIYGGSTLKCAGKIFPYEVGGRTGCSLQLSALQIIDLAESTGGVSFDAEEGAFLADEAGDGGDGQAYNF